MYIKNSDTYLHISHTDLDGYSCSYLTHLFFHGGFIDTINVDYSNFESVLKENIKKNYYKAIFITDISINGINMIRDIFEYNMNGLRIYVFDHHQSTYIAWKDFMKVNQLQDRIIEDIPYWLYVKHDGSACGTTLWYDFLKRFELSAYQEFEKSNPFLIQNVNAYVEAVYRYDNYLHKEKDDYCSQMTNDIFHLIGPEYFKEMIVSNLKFQHDRINPDPIGSWFGTIHVNDLYSFQESKKTEYIDHALERMVPIDLTFENLHIRGNEDKKETIKCAYVYAERFPSEVGHAIKEKYAEVEVAIIRTTQNILSFRSRKNIDCSKIAELFGGGGHKQAAGAVLKPPYENEDIQNLLDQILACSNKI